MSLSISDSMDQLLDRFDQAWNDPTPPRIEDYLDKADPDRRLALLIELVRIDLERRLTAGEKVRLEAAYFPRFPELATETPAIVTLVKHEFAVRRRNEPELMPAEYLARFPQCQTELVAQLPTLDEIPKGEPQLNTADAPGELDLRGYKLIEPLDEGGMGEVYRCSDPALGRDLAIKIMKANLRGQAGIERRFLREARITASLQHPGIVPVHNLGRLSDGRLHYTMRLVRGRTFADILKDEAGKPERLPYLLSIFEKICQAAAYAHSKHVIHRDLKPLNVMVGKFGEVQVLDWGLAKLLSAEGAAADEEPRMVMSGTLIHTESDDTPEKLTRAGTVIGTPPYMSPEQAQSDWELVDERTDVFALGSILCEILTGQPAYRGPDGSEVFRRAKRGDLADALLRLQNCGADTMLTNLCLECLSYECEGRPRHAGVMAERVSLYQAEVQERLRRAELERVEAEARTRVELARLEAEEARTREALERRARRRLLAFSIAVMITIAIAFVLVRHSANQANEAKNRALELTAEKEILKAKSDSAEKEKIARQDAEKSQRIAKAEARKAQEVAKFLGGIFEASDPLGLTSLSMIFPRAEGENLSGQVLLERGAKKCQRELKDQPDVQSAVLTAIGNAYVNLGEYEKGKTLLEKALRLAEQSEGKLQDIAAIKHSLGSLYHAQGHYDTAEKLYRDALKLRKDAQPINELFIADTLFNLGWLLTDKEDHEAAENFYHRCLALRTKILGKKDRLVALCQIGLATVYLDQNKNYLRAWSLINQSIQIFQELEGNQPSLAKAIGLFQQGIILLHGPRSVPSMNLFVSNPREKGVKLLLQCLQLVKDSTLGKNHLIVAFVTGTLAIEHLQAGEDDLAKPYFEECLKIVEGRDGLWHPKMDKVTLPYAALLNRQQKKQEADRFCHKVLEAREARFGANHPQVANALVAYALIRDKFDPECKSMLIRAREMYQKAQPLKGATNLQMYAFCLNQLGAIALDVHRNPAEAEKIMRTAWGKFRDCSSIYPAISATLANNLAIALLWQSKVGEAEQLLKEVRSICEKAGQNGQITLKANLNALAGMYLRQHHPVEVAALSLERRKRWPNDPDQLYLAGRNLLECAPLVGQGKTELAPAERKLRQDYLTQGIAACQTAVDLYRKAGGPKQPSYKFCLTWLARGLYNSQRYPEAEKLVEESLDLCRKDLGNRNPEIAYALNFRAQIRLAQRKYEGIEQNLREAESILAAVPKEQERVLGAALHNEKRVTLELLIQLYDSTGRTPAESETYHRSLLEQNRRQFGADDPRTAGQMAALAFNMLRQHKYSDAEPLLRECLKVRESKQPDNWATFNARSLLGASLLGQKKYTDAEPLLLQSYQEMKAREAKIPPQGKIRLTEALERLVQLYEATEQKDKADLWRKKLQETKAAAKKPKP